MKNRHNSIVKIPVCKSSGGNSRMGKYAKSPGGFFFPGTKKKVMSILKICTPPPKCKKCAGGGLENQKIELTFLFFEILIFCKLDLKDNSISHRLGPI